MALLLARMLVVKGSYDLDGAAERYRFWLDSEPFDCGHTIRQGLRGRPNLQSQANGALMRISPLGIFGAGRDREEVGEWALESAGLMRGTGENYTSSGAQGKPQDSIRGKDLTEHGAAKFPRG
jgi:ADP-ribosylglycohydrolase